MKLGGPSKNCTPLLYYQIPKSKCSSQGMDIHVDSSKTLMRESRLVSVVDPQHRLRFRQTFTTQ